MRIREKTHAQRVKLAEEICNEIKCVLRDDLRALVIYASVAKNADGPYSDLEMMAITSDKYEEHCSEYIHDGIKVEVDFVPLESAIKQTSTIDRHWPLKADQWHRIMPIYVKEGDDCLTELQVACRKSMEDDELFKKNVAAWMLETYELMGTLMNAWERGIRSDLVTGLFFLSSTMIRIVGFVNRYFYQSYRNAWEESKTLPNLPKDYTKLIELVHGEVATSLEDRYNAALELWENIKLWMAEQGIEWEKGNLKLPKKKEA